MKESDLIKVSAEERISELVNELTASTPMYVVEVVLRGRKGSRVLDVFVDSDESLDVDALARLSRELSVILDVEDLIDGHFNLNVSSPGLDRPLVSPRQFRKNIGRRIAITDSSAVSGGQLEGVLVEAGSEDFEIETTEGRRERFARSDSLEVRVLPPW